MVSVKRLLLLLTLLLTPGAQAMDYVKCEAMQKALDRLLASKDSELAQAHDEIVMTAMHARQPGVPISELKPAFDRRDSVQKTIRDKYQPRIDKVRADYEAEGCY